MKKFLLSVVLLFAAIFTSVAHAAYPTHWNDDRNFVLVGGHQGAMAYMKKSSVRVEQHTPPIYVISVDIYHVDDPEHNKTRYRSIEVMRFRYDWDTRQMYKQDRTGKWNKMMKGTSHTAPAAGEMAFYVAYRMKFFADYPDDFYASGD